MLYRDDDCVDVLRVTPPVSILNSVIIQSHGYLAFTIWSHPRYLTGLLNHVESSGQSLRQGGCYREVSASQLIGVLGFIACEPEHDALVTGSLGIQVAVDSLADVLRLSRDECVNLAKFR